MACLLVLSAAIFNPAGLLIYLTYTSLFGQQANRFACSDKRFLGYKAGARCAHWPQAMNYHDSQQAEIAERSKVVIEVKAVVDI
jgi:hypothetical protein